MAEDTRSGTRKARLASGITVERAAAIIGRSGPTYVEREADPEKFTVGEFFRLYREVDPDMRPIMMGDLEALMG